MSSFGTGRPSDIADVGLDSSLALVSVNNSSTAPLGISGTFTGVGEDVSQYSTIVFYVDSNVSGTLKAEFSIDNVNWDRQKTIPVDVNIGTGSVHTLEVISQYFRIVYDNGAVAQTHFRLQTIYHKIKSGFLTSSPDEVISKINDAQIVRVANDTITDLSRSLYADKIAIHKFGENSNIPSAQRDIWSYGDAAGGNIDYPWPTVSDTLEIVSDSAGDDVGQPNAHSIAIEGLDSNWDLISETINLDGLTPVTTINSFRRVNRAFIVDVGTYGAANNGNITISHTTSTDVLGYIVSGRGQTEQTMYTIPNTYTGYLRHAHASVAAGANKDATVRGFRREAADDVVAPFAGGAKRVFHSWQALSGIAELDYFSMISYPAKTDIWWTSEGNAGSAVSVVYDLFLIQNDNPINPQ